jgi:hypothetical protein
LTQKLEASLLGQLSPQALEQIKSYMRQGPDMPPSMPSTPAGTSNTIEQQQSMNIGTPITSLTPLQSSVRNLNSEIIFVSDLTPISPKEMLPSDFFFSKKRKAIVKMESH